MGAEKYTPERRAAFAHAVTPDGIAFYDKIKARRDALPAEPDEVDDGE